MPGADSSYRGGFAKLDGPVTFFLYDLKCYFFLNDVDIILEFKQSFEKNCQSFLKILKRTFFWDTLYIILFRLQNYRNLKKNILKSKFYIDRIFTPENPTRKHHQKTLPRKRNLVYNLTQK